MRSGLFGEQGQPCCARAGCHGRESGGAVGSQRLIRDSTPQRTRVGIKGKLAWYGKPLQGTSRLLETWLELRGRPSGQVSWRERLAKRRLLSHPWCILGHGMGISIWIIGRPADAQAGAPPCFWYAICLAPTCRGPEYALSVAFTLRSSAWRGANL